MIRQEAKGAKDMMFPFLEGRTEGRVLGTLGLPTVSSSGVFRPWHTWRSDG